MLEGARVVAVVWICVSGWAKWVFGLAGRCWVAVTPGRVVWEAVARRGAVAPAAGAVPVGALAVGCRMAGGWGVAHGAASPARLRV